MHQGRAKRQPEFKYQTFKALRVLERGESCFAFVLGGGVDCIGIRIIHFPRDSQKRIIDQDLCIITVCTAT